MTSFDYKRFYDKVGMLNGWDFSSVKCTIEGEVCKLYDEMAKRCNPSDLLLDIGTGGGEGLLSSTSAALLKVGIDHSEAMFNTANENLRKSNKSNVHFFQMDAAKLDFPMNFFDILTCRHSPFYVGEVVRVLKEGGVFLTQQVSEADKLNIKHSFGRGQEFDVEDGTLKLRYFKELTETGFTEIQSFDYNTTEYYHTYEDLVFLLKFTPIVPDFGQNEHDFELLRTFIEDNQTEKGIKTNAKRFMIIAKK